MNAKRSLIVLVVAASLVAVGSVRAETPEEMIAGAKALDAAFLAAFNSADAEAYAACYWQSPDVISFPPDSMEARGWEAIKAASQGVSTMPGTKLELTESHYMVAGEVVITWGRWRVSFAGPDGNPVTVHGRYTDVKAKRDGKWVYLIDHASVPMAPPPG